MYEDAIKKNILYTNKNEKIEERGLNWAVLVARLVILTILMI